MLRINSINHPVVASVQDEKKDVEMQIQLECSGQRMPGRQGYLVRKFYETQL